MSSTLPAIVLTALLGGAVGGGVTLFMNPGSSAPDDAAANEAGMDGTTARVAKAERENAELQQRIGSLEVQLDLVSNQLAKLENSGSGEALTLGSELRRESVASEGGSEDLSALDDTQLEDRVNAAMGRIKSKQDAERDKKAKERANERLDKQIVELIEKLHLSPYQATELKTMMQEQSDKRTEAMKAMRVEDGPPDFQAMRTSMEKSRAEQDQRMAGFLNTEQIASYKAWEGETFMGGFGGFGGRRGGGGGGAGGAGGSPTPASGVVPSPPASGNGQQGN